MAKLDILEFPDPRLRTIAATVTVFDAALHAQIDDMFETMYAAPGIGLAATQVNIHKRLLVLDVSENKEGRLVLINPELLEQHGIEEMEEGCLSFPGIYAKVQRADAVKVRAQDEHGAVFELEASGLLAVCIQHEMDHIEGKLFVDYLSPLKRDRIRKSLEKKHKQDAEDKRAAR